MLSWLRELICKVLSNPLFDSVLATILFFFLWEKATHLIHHVTGMLPPPPQPLLPDLPAENNQKTIEFLVLLAAVIYLAWHYWPKRLSPAKPFRSLVVWIVVSIVVVVPYRFLLPIWLCCDYEGERYIVGLYYTQHGKEYAKEHGCAEMIRNHPGVLHTLMDQDSILYSQAIYHFAYTLVAFTLLLTTIQVMETLVTLVRQSGHTPGAPASGDHGHSDDRPAS